jgi:hypothetical protein
MHRLIAEQAGHSILADAMIFVDYTVPDLERIEAERRASRKRGETEPDPTDAVDPVTRDAEELSCDAAPGS